MFKVAIIGGELTGDYTKFKEKCIYFLRNKVKEDSIMIYTTGDKFVDEFAKRYRITTRVFYCDFKTYNRNALKVRAENMLEDCDGVIAFRNDLKDIQMITKLAAEKKLQVKKVP